MQNLPEFTKGQKVKYLSHPATIKAVQFCNIQKRFVYSVKYTTNWGQSFTVATQINNRGNEIQ
jgi:hypothetical protein